MKLFSLKGNSDLERELLSETGKRLNVKQKQYSKYPQAWQRKIETTFVRFSWTERALFSTLHRHFEGRQTPGLPSVLRFARSVAKHVNARKEGPRQQG